MMQQGFNIHELLAKLELPLDSLDRFQEVQSIPAAKETLNTFKELVKQQKKDLSRKYHPDKGGDQERMKEINNICDWVLGSEIVGIPRLQRIVRYYSYFTGTSSATTSTDFYY